jgi:hypothetical protein
MFHLLVRQPIKQVLNQGIRTVASQTQKSQQVFDRENKFGAHNYGSLPVALDRGKGMF